MRLTFFDPVWNGGRSGQIHSVRYAWSEQLSIIAAGDSLQVDSAIKITAVRVSSHLAG